MITCSIVLDRAPHAKAKVVVSAGSAIHDVMAFQTALERIFQHFPTYMLGDLMSDNGKSDVTLECKMDPMMVASWVVNAGSSKD